MKIAVGLALALISLSVHATDKIKVIIGTDSNTELNRALIDQLQDKVRESSEFELSTDPNHATFALQLAAHQQGTILLLSVNFDVQDPWTGHFVTAAHAPFACRSDLVPSCAQTIFDELVKDREWMIEGRERLRKIKPRTEPLP